MALFTLLHLMYIWKLDLNTGCKRLYAKIRSYDSWGICSGFRGLSSYNISLNSIIYLLLRQLRQTSAISSASPGLQSSSQRLGVMPLVLF